VVPVKGKCNAASSRKTTKRRTSVTWPLSPERGAAGRRGVASELGRTNFGAAATPHFDFAWWSHGRVVHRSVLACPLSTTQRSQVQLDTGASGQRCVRAWKSPHPRPDTSAAVGLAGLLPGLVKAALFLSVIGQILDHAPYPGLDPGPGLRLPFPAAPFLSLPIQVPPHGPRPARLGSCSLRLVHKPARPPTRQPVLRLLLRRSLSLSLSLSTLVRPLPIHPPDPASSLHDCPASPIQSVQPTNTRPLIYHLPPWFPVPISLNSRHLLHATLRHLEPPARTPVPARQSLLSQRYHLAGMF
jgi:hypothetical protein